VRIDITVPSEVPAYMMATHMVFSSYTIHFPTIMFTMGRFAAHRAPVRNLTMYSVGNETATTGTRSVRTELPTTHISNTYLVLNLESNRTAFACIRWSRGKQMRQIEAHRSTSNISALRFHFSAIDPRYQDERPQDGKRSLASDIQTERSDTYINARMRRTLKPSYRACALTNTRYRFKYTNHPYATYRSAKYPAGNIPTR